MTTFAKATFDAVGYLACRPTYAAKVYDTIIQYHSPTGQFDRALDLGCGPGFIAANLASKFNHVVGLDPSKKMVEAAIQPDSPASPIEYRVGNAEDLLRAGVEPNSLDLVVAGQAAHWFDYPKVWRQLTQTVRPGGTVAFIGYAEMVFPNHPHLNKLISHHSRSKDTLGPYWQPGRKIVEGLLDAVPFPVSPKPPTLLRLAGSTFSVDRIAEPTLLANDIDTPTWDTETAVRLKEMDGKQWLMTKRMTLSSLEGYFRTWSALHAYQEVNPDDIKKRGKGGENGDIVDRLVADIKQKMGDEVSKEGEFEVGWPLVLMMIKKKP